MKVVPFLLFILIGSTRSHAQSQYFNQQLDSIHQLLRTEKNDKARILLNDFRSSRWAEKDCKIKAEYYKLYGNLYYNLYEDDEALRYYIDSAYEKIKKCGPLELENDLLSNIGGLYDYHDKQLLANKYYKKLKQNYLSDQSPLNKGSFEHLINLAAYYEGHNDLYNLFLCAWKAKQIAKKYDLNDSDVSNLLGIYFEKTKQFEEALAIYSNATKILKAKGQEVPVKMMFNHAMTYRQMGKYSEALSILKNIDQKEISEDYAYAILNLEGIIYSKLGQYEISDSKFIELDNIPNSKYSYHHENRADAKLESGDISGAIEIYKNRILFLENKWAHIGNIPTFTPDFLELTELKCLLAKAHYLESKRGDEWVRKDVIGDFQDIRKNIDQIITSNWESQSSSHILNEVYPNLYYIILSHLDEYKSSGDSKFRDQAYQIISETKNQILERDIQSRIQLREDLSDTILSKYYALKSELNSQYLKENKSKDSRIQLIEEFEKYQFKFDSLFNKYNSNITLKPQSLNEIKNSLNEDEAFLDIFFSDENLIRFWITKKEIHASSAQLSTSIIHDFLSNLKSGKPIPQPSNDSIYGTIFSNIDLSSVKNIIVHSDGLLHNIPLGALKNPHSKDYLIKNFSFRYLLSTDSLYTDKYPWMEKKCLGIASNYTSGAPEIDSTFAFDLGQLTGAVEELEHLTNHYKTTNLVNQQASFQNLSNQTKNNNFNIVQLSLHGILDDRLPASSGLIFENENGLELVNLNKMTSLNFDTDLTIVNSCHSGDGDHITGEAISNINTSLFISGSRANIVNLWSSSDKASAQILKHFHNELNKGKPKSRALQLAKLNYLSSTSPSFTHPKYWSSLALYGNDSSIQSRKFNYLYLLIGVLLTLILIFFIKKSK